MKRLMMTVSAAVLLAAATPAAAQDAARMAEDLHAIGYDVTTGVGGTGVIAVLRNGDGPNVMIRGDMDDLPLAEASGLANAFTAHQVDTDGVDKPFRLQ